MPLVSVVIPMRNAERFVKDTLASVLAQEGVELEVVVVDDGSTDGSADVVRSAGDGRVRIVPGPRRGISAAFNAGLAAARGDIFARCDADDLYPPGRLAWQAAWLGAHPDFGAVSGSYTMTAPDGRPVAEQRSGDAGLEVTDELRRGVGRSHLCAYAIRTDVLRAVGGCREWFVTSEDADLQYRLAEATRVWYEPRNSYLYRLHDASITHSRRDAERRFYEAQARRFLEQRRAGGQDDLQRGCPPPPPSASADAAQPEPVDGRGAGAHVQELLLGAAWREHREGLKGRAVRTGLRACFAAPARASAWKSLGALLIRPAPRTRAREKPSCG